MSVKNYNVNEIQFEIKCLLELKFQYTIKMK